MEKILSELSSDNLSVTGLMTNKEKSKWQLKSILIGYTAYPCNYCYSHQLPEHWNKCGNCLAWHKWYDKETKS